VTIEAFRDSAKKLQRETGTTLISILPNSESQYATVVQVMDIARQVGLVDQIIMHAPEKKPQSDFQWPPGVAAVEIAETTAELKQNGNLFLDGERVQFDQGELDSALAAKRLALGVNAGIFIHAHPEVLHNKVVQVMNAARRAGISRMRFSEKE